MTKIELLDVLRRQIGLDMVDHAKIVQSLVRACLHVRQAEGR